MARFPPIYMYKCFMCISWACVDCRRTSHALEDFVKFCSARTIVVLTHIRKMRRAWTMAELETDCPLKCLYSRILLEPDDDKADDHADDQPDSSCAIVEAPAVEAAAASAPLAEAKVDASQAGVPAFPSTTTTLQVSLLQRHNRQHHHPSSMPQPIQ